MEHDREVERVLSEIRQSIQVENNLHEDHTSQCYRSMAQIGAHLTITERTWNRLPPILSYRFGWKAQLELWIKRKLKQTTHWYTWEQINFNHSVNSILRATRLVLSTHEQRQRDLQISMDKLAGQIEELRAFKTQLESTKVIRPESGTDQR